MPNWLVTTTIGRGSLLIQKRGGSRDKFRPTLQSCGLKSMWAAVFATRIMPHATAVGTLTMRASAFQSISRIRGPSRAPDPGGRARLADDLCRAEARHEIDEDHFAAFAFDELVSHHLLAPVVAPFDQHLGTHAADQLERGILLEDDDEVYGFERRQHFGTRVHLLQGPPLALQTSHGSIVVEADDEAVAGGVCLGQELDVAGVQEVETAVGEADAQAPPFGEP